MIRRFGENKKLRRVHLTFSMFSSSIFDLYLFDISRSVVRCREATISRDKNVIGTRHARNLATGEPRLRARLANQRVESTMIPRSVNIRDRRYIRSLPVHPFSLPPRGREGLVDDRARVCVARADNNYFRNFLAFRATSPSIRKSYKLDCHIHAQIQNTEGGGTRPAAWPVKYHLIPREIRFNFARHNIPGSLPNVEFPAAQCGESKSFGVIFRRKMFRSSACARSERNRTLPRDFCEERDRYRRVKMQRDLISPAACIFVFVPPASYRTLILKLNSCGRCLFTQAPGYFSSEGVVFIARVIISAHKRAEKSLEISSRGFGCGIDDGGEIQSVHQPPCVLS